MTKIFILKKSYLITKKYTAYEIDNDGVRISPFIHFDSPGYPDYTKHHSSMRKAQYISRQSSYQTAVNWNLSGLYSPSFWTRWVLWNHKTKKKLIKDMEKRFNLHIIRQ